MNRFAHRFRVKKAIYAVYDVKDNDVLVYSGTCEEIADYFGTSPNVILSGITQGKLKSRRYRIERVKDVEEDYED